MVYAFGGVPFLPEPLVSGCCIYKIAVAMAGTQLYGYRTEPGQVFLQNQFYDFVRISIILCPARLNKCSLS